MKKKKFKNSIFYVILMCIVFMIIVPIILSIPLVFIEHLTNRIPEPYKSINESYLLFSIPSLLSFIILFYLKDNKKICYIFDLKNNKIVRGLCLGFLLNMICVLVAGVSGSLKIDYNGFNIFVFLFAFIAILIPAAIEELMCRGYIQYKLLDIYKNPKIAIFVNSIIFSLLHIFNDGITVIALISIFAVGLFLSLVTYYSKNLWEAIFIHTAWNFTQTILLGLPNSGNPTPYSVFKVIESSNNFAYDTVFGVESSIVSIIVFTIMIVLIQYIHRKKYVKEK